MRYGEALVREVLAKHISESKGRARTVLQVTAAALDKVASHLEFYIACFCREPGLLSQWRGYGTSAGRFCIAFESQKLFYETSALTYHLKRVVYAREDQIAKIEGVIAKALESVHQLLQIKSELQKECGEGICVALFEKLVQEMCFFKHPGFAEEKEWRSVHQLEDPAKIQFEPSAGTIRPFVELFTGRGEPGLLPIDHVIVGSSLLA